MGKNLVSAPVEFKKVNLPERIAVDGAAGV
jgi:hypothetical protein